MEEKIQKELADRTKLLNDLISTSRDYLNNTMFWIIEANPAPNKGKPMDVLLKELDHMFLDNMVETYKLVPHDEHVLRSCMLDTLRQHALRMELKKFRAKEGSHFYIHTFVVRREGEENNLNYVHHVDKFSFTAGMGEKNWEKYTAVQQQEVRDFVFDVYSGVGDQNQTMDIKLSPARITCAFPLKTMVPTAKEL